MGRSTLNALLIASVLLPSSAWATTATIGASKDNSIFQNNPFNSGGGGAGIFAGTNGMNSPRRGLMAFDIAGSVPAGSTITNVELTLYLGNAPNDDPQNIELHKLTKDWGEGSAGSTNPSIMMSGMGYPANEGEATWSEAMRDIDAWTNPGALSDIGPVASATLSVSGPVDTAFRWESTAALVNDVQGWLDAPTTNFGWLLFNTNEATTRSLKAFYSREATQDSSNLPNSLDLSWRPSLNVTYVSSGSPTGDYNGNGFVDAADYVVWRRTLNQTDVPPGSGADGFKDGKIDGKDYDYWRARFGNPTGGFASGTTVPEPSTSGFAFVALGLLAGPLAFRR